METNYLESMSPIAKIEIAISIPILIKIKIVIPIPIAILKMIADLDLDRSFTIADGASDPFAYISYVN